MAVALSGMTLHTNNDADGNWTGTDGPSEDGFFIQGGNSEQWQLTKNASSTATLAVSSTLNATRGVFVFWMSTILAAVYTDINILLESSAGNDKTFLITTVADPVISGVFVPLVLDYVNKGTPTGTFVPASFSSLDIIYDNSSSGNIRGIPNAWIDAMYYGPGHTISGTTTGDTLFAESAAVDELVGNRYGILQNFNSIIYSFGDIDLSGTDLTSISETLVFVDTPNGYDTYEFDITGTVVFTNTAIQASGAIDFNMDSSTATAFTMNGGSISGFLSLTTGASQTTDGVVLNSGGTTVLANTPVGSTFNTCGQISFTGAGSLNNCIINEPTAPVLTSSLNLIDGCSFISDGTGYAVDLGTITSTQAMAWNSTTTGYAATDGTTGNEVIKVTVNNAVDLTINVSGVSSPTVHATLVGTGTISIINAVALTIESNVSLLGAEIRIYDYNGTGGSFGDELQGVESAPASTYVYSGASSNLIYIQIMKDGYEEFGQSVTMPSSPATFTANLETEENV